MNTTAISSPVNIASDSASLTQQSEAPVDTPFNQVLSREMAARETAEPNRADAGKASEEAQAARAEAGSNSAGFEQELTATANAAADRTVAADAATAKTRAEGPETEADTTLSAASADLLALLVSLTQQVAPAQTGTSAAAGAQTQAQADADTADAAPTLLAPGALTPAETVAAAAVATTTTTLTAGAALQSPTLQSPALANGAADAVGRKSGRGHEPAPAAAISPNDRSAGETAAGDKKIAPDSKGFDGRLTQARDEKAAPDAGAAKASAGRAEFGAQQNLRDAAAAKTALDGQQGGAAPINISGLSQAQAQHVQHAQSVPGHMADRLAPRVGTPAWDQALAQKVVWMVGGELQSASLTLNPPDLGPLQVVLNVANSQATANFTAAQPEVRQALEAAMPKLREMLGEAGIELSQASVSAGMPNSQQNAFERSQQGQGAQHGNSRSEDADQAAPVVRSQAISGGQGLVDTFA